MAINKNHEFEELNGIKCGIVEKKVSAERVEFLKKLLEFNGFTVVVAPTPAPKVAAPPAPKPVGEGTAETPAPAQPETAAPPPPPETFSVGVTDITFNPINAIFGRLLKSPGGHIVTLAYWEQKEKESHDEVPYYDAKY